MRTLYVLLLTALLAPAAAQADDRTKPVRRAAESARDAVRKKQPGPKKPPADVAPPRDSGTAPPSVPSLPKPSN